MKRHICSAIAVLGYAAALNLCPAIVRADTLSCKPIKQIPFTAKSPGTYCLQKKFIIKKQFGAAITIESNNVTIDLNGNLIRNMQSGNKAIGVFAYNRRFVTIRNGTLRGFEKGIKIDKDFAFPGEPYLIEDMFIDESGYEGISVYGDEITIRNNWIMNVGSSSAAWPKAIHIQASEKQDRARIVNNDISNVKASGAGYGIAVSNFGNALVENNRISGAAYGVSGYGSGCFRRDNITSSISLIRYEACTDLGNNK